MIYDASDARLYWQNLYKNISSVQKASFFGVLIWGLITHITAFSEPLMYLDGTHYEGLYGTYTSGRWMLGFFEELGKKCLGVYELPFINGFITLFFIALSSMLIVSHLKVRSNVIAALIGAILVSFPCVATLFSYMFTAPSYSLSLLLSISAICLVNDKPSLLRIAFASCLICMSLGIYQAYLTCAASFALLIVFCDALRQSSTDVKALFTKGIIFIITLLIGLILYLSVNKLVLQLKDLTSTAYKGIDKMGQFSQFSLAGLKTALLYAYTDQIHVHWIGIISSHFMTYLTKLVELLTVFLFALIVFRKRKEKKLCIFVIVLFVLLPLAFNSIYLLCIQNGFNIHALMRYSLVFTYIVPLLLIEIIAQSIDCKKFDKMLSTVSLAVLVSVPLFYTYRDNTAYLHASTVQKQSILFFNSLITRIRSTDGYRDELPVAYIGEGFSDKSIAYLPTQNIIWTYNLYISEEDIINSFWKEFCALHLGWAPVEPSDTAELADSEEVKAMPCYPDSGSIKVINDIVVVKISDVE